MWDSKTFLFLQSYDFLLSQVNITELCSGAPKGSFWLLLRTAKK